MNIQSIPKVGNIYFSSVGTLFKVTNVSDNNVNIVVLNGVSRKNDGWSLHRFNKHLNNGEYIYLGTEVTDIMRLLYG